MNTSSVQPLQFSPKPTVNQYEEVSTGKTIREGNKSRKIGCGTTGSLVFVQQQLGPGPVQPGVVSFYPENMNISKFSKMFYKTENIKVFRVKSSMLITYKAFLFYYPEILLLDCATVI